MDTSAEYIKMCDCEEIQGEWDGEIADFVYNKLERGIHTIDYVLTCTCKNCCNDYTWLPRIDQLIEMLNGTIYENRRDFNRFVESEHHNEGGCGQQGCDGRCKSVYNYDYYTTFEQLWLALVMKEKYNKTWNGKEWEGPSKPETPSIA